MAAVDKTFGGSGQPASHAFVAVKHDTDELPTITRALYVGGAGNAVVVMEGGETVTFSGIAAGTILPIRIKQLKSTDTTATLILGLY